MQIELESALDRWREAERICEFETARAPRLAAVPSEVALVLG